jgi:hypothetical protein
MKISKDKYPKIDKNAECEKIGCINCERMYEECG